MDRDDVRESAHNAFAVVAHPGRLFAVPFALDGVYDRDANLVTALRRARYSTGLADARWKHEHLLAAHKARGLYALFVQRVFASTPISAVVIAACGGAKLSDPYMTHGFKHFAAMLACVFQPFGTPRPFCVVTANVLVCDPSP